MIPEKYYHIYNHANGFENLFRSDENYRYFLRRYSNFINPVAETFAYCLMPNHIHFLIRIRKVEELEKAFGKFETSPMLEKRISKQFANLFSSYAQAFNKMYQRRGSLFIPNFKRKEVNHETYLTNLILYIHLNPVHHGFVKDVSEWSWSSYQPILLNNKFFDSKENVISWFGTHNEYIKSHERINYKNAHLEMDF